MQFLRTFKSPGEWPACAISQEIWRPPSRPGGRAYFSPEPLSSEKAHLILKILNILKILLKNGQQAKQHLNPGNLEHPENPAPDFANFRASMRVVSVCHLSRDMAAPIETGRARLLLTGTVVKRKGETGRSLLPDFARISPKLVSSGKAHLILKILLKILKILLQKGPGQKNLTFTQVSCILLIWKFYSTRPGDTFQQ